jgi:predicted RNA-binding protein with PIN domain
VKNARGEIAAALAEGVVPAASDPVDVAALAYLLRPAGWQRVLRSALDALERAPAPPAGPDTEVARLREQLREARAQAKAEVERVRAELRASKGEVAELRRKLHEARNTCRVALAAAQVAQDAEAGARAAAATSASATEAELRRLRSRLADVEGALETARRATREGRTMEDARLRLLLDTVVDAAQGLRRELALPPTTLRPADAVAAVQPVAAGVGDVAVRALERDDPAVLDDLLALPQVHLVVDGYNVTKTGYGGLPLEAQRSRLIGGLSSLAARSGAEVTVCFDGAALTGPVPSASSRTVRVLFSRPGESADELIRRLVRNEPRGRPVVVVSSDREVAEGVLRAGARAVPASALLRRLDRG